MFRISKLADYGTMVLTHMARFPGRSHSSSGLAATLGLAQPTVSKVLKTLTRHGLVQSFRGLNGGYDLARPAAQISIAEIIDALEEQAFGLTECSATIGLCDYETNCVSRANWQRLNVVVRRALDGVSLEDMSRPLPLQETPAQPLRRQRPELKGE